MILLLQGATQDVKVVQAAVVAVDAHLVRDAVVAANVTVTYKK